MGKKKTTTPKPAIRESPPSSTSMTVLSFVVLIVAIVLGLIYAFQDHTTSTIIPTVLFQEHHIPRRNIDPSFPYSSYLDQKNQPVVIVGEILAKYPRWNISDVLAMTTRPSTSSLDGFFRHTSPFFGPYYDPKRPMHNLLTIQGRPPYDSNASLPLKSIAKIFHQRSPKIFYSYSNSLNHINPTLEQQLELTELLALNPSHSSVNLWFGMRGGITPCHYDGYHNMSSSPPLLFCSL
jgi:hypothetical protein